MTIHGDETIAFHVYLTDVEQILMLFFVLLSHFDFGILFFEYWTFIAVVSPFLGAWANQQLTLEYDLDQSSIFLRSRIFSPTSSPYSSNSHQWGSAVHERAVIDIERVPRKFSRYTLFQEQ